MDRFIDFSNSKVALRPFGGSDRKFRIKYGEKYYMLKFTEEHVKKSEVSTSHENNAISEYISSRIAKSIGLDVHSTTLGEYQKDSNSEREICVACEDFRSLEEENIEFYEFGIAIYGPSEFKKIARLDQIYKIYNDSHVFPEYLKRDGIARFWDTFVVDALVGNFDRHTGNWGVVSNIKTLEIKLAPIYDFGSTLFPIISDEGILDISSKPKELVDRCFLFPSATMYLTSEKKGKPGYYDMLASNYNSDCTKALLRIFPRIDMGKIYDIIDNTPVISDTRRVFYKKMLTLRYELILHNAYKRCVNQNYDKNALYRLENNISLDEKGVRKLESENTELISRILSANYNDQVQEMSSENDSVGADYDEI